MQIKLLKLMALFVFSSGIFRLQAQDAVIATGGEAIGSGGNASYSVGQVAYCTIGDNNRKLTQGVQQSFKILLVSENSEAIGIQLIPGDNSNPSLDFIKSISDLSDSECVSEVFYVYPNPSANLITLTVENCTVENLRYTIYNANGMLLKNGEIVGNKTLISLGHLDSDVFILRIKRDAKELKTFKIIKIHPR